MLSLADMLKSSISPMAVVDIGAMSIGGADDPWCLLAQKGVARVIGFEPLDSECKKLNGLYGETHTYLPYCIGDGNQRPFHITNTGMTSSLYQPNHELVDLFQNLGELMQVVKTESFKTVRLDDIPELSEGIDYLKLDVQGAERDILLNAPRLLAYTMVVQTEVEFVPLYKDQPLFAEVDACLRQHGFMLHKFLGTAGRAFKPLLLGNDINRPISQDLWSDVVYVKDITTLRFFPAQKLLTMAIILNDIYQSVDLAHFVLTVYDNKQGTTFAEQYLNKITGFNN